MNDRTLVKVSVTQDCFSFRTVSRSRKSPHGFMILRDVLDDLRDRPQMTVTVRDIRSFAELRCEPAKGTLHIHFIWLSGDGDRLTGWEETVVIPFETLMAFHGDGDGDRWKVLSMETQTAPRLVFHGQKNLHEALKNQLVRRKLVRFLRDNFKWKNVEEVAFYDDFVPYSFFFREMRNGESGMCGGLILHGQNDLDTAQYSIHT